MALAKVINREKEVLPEEFAIWVMIPEVLCPAAKQMF